jgi:CRISPR/Cas system type I-B associated protein Csh2 (Cas7 group RAMP superfamily)
MQVLIANHPRRTGKGLLLPAIDILRRRVNWTIWGADSGSWQARQNVEGSWRSTSDHQTRKLKIEKRKRENEKSAAKSCCIIMSSQNIQPIIKNRYVSVRRMI